MSEPISWNIIKTEKKEEKKDTYKPDKRISKIYEAKEKFNSEMRQEKFKQWLNRLNTKNISINNILNNLCRDVENIVTESGFTISNKKILRDEISTFIYKESVPNAQEEYH
tara:strand:+ start:700 stop:1032 length:333 start_codon:yes stop_codon:yes gene_type:complete